MTRTRFNVPNLATPLPQADVLRAANAFNDVRYNHLTVQQRVFVDAYLSNGFDAAEAAIEARYTTDPKEAKKIGSRLCKRAHIERAFQLAVTYYRETQKIRREDLIDELKKIAFANIGDFFKNDGFGDPHLVMPHDDDNHKLAVVQEITVDVYNEGRGDDAREVKKIKFKLYDKLSAIEKLVKMLNLQEGIPDPDAPGGVTNNVTTNVQQINFVTVPAGQFIPAPLSDKIINHTALADRTIQPIVPGFVTQEPSASS